MPEPPKPQSLQDLQSWIASTTLNYTTADFPDVGDFLICELESALLQAVANLKAVRERLRHVEGPVGAFAGCAELAVSSREIIGAVDRSGLLRIEKRDAVKLVIAAKYQGCMAFQNVIVAIAVATKKLKDETKKVKAAVSKYQREVQAKEMLMGMLQSSSSDTSPTSAASNGDDDDWFVVGSETQTPASTPGVPKKEFEWDARSREQNKLYEEIEVKLAGVGIAKEEEKNENERGFEEGKKEKARQETIVVAIDDVAPYYYG